ncbi:hypothetical protein CBL_01134 [Carabus blaptoides fortunei]
MATANIEVLIRVAFQLVKKSEIAEKPPLTEATIKTHLKHTHLEMRMNRSFLSARKFIEIRMTVARCKRRDFWLDANRDKALVQQSRLIDQDSSVDMIMSVASSVARNEEDKQETGSGCNFRSFARHLSSWLGWCAHGTRTVATGIITAAVGRNSGTLSRKAGHI